MKTENSDIIAEIQRLEDVITKTKSEKLRTDYRKAVRRMKKEMRDYDSFRRAAGARV